MKFKCVINNKLDVIALFVLILISLYVLQNMQSYLDVMAADDALYMYVGDLFPLNLIMVQYGPIYTSFLKMLSLFCMNKIQAYYLLVMCMSILPTISLYIFLRIFGKLNIPVSILLAVLFFCSLENMSFTIWSKVSHFAISFIFLDVSYISLETRMSKYIKIII